MKRNLDHIYTSLFFILTVSTHPEFTASLLYQLPQSWLGGGYMGIFTCESSSNYTLKICALY